MTRRPSPGASSTSASAKIRAHTPWPTCLNGGRAANGSEHLLSRLLCYVACVRRFGDTRAESVAHRYLCQILRPGQCPRRSAKLGCQDKELLPASRQGQLDSPVASHKHQPQRDDPNHKPTNGANGMGCAITAIEVRAYWLSSVRCSTSVVFAASSEL